MQDIFFCEKYPIEDIVYSHKIYHEGSEEWRPALLANIREHGLANPLIIYNHDRGPKLKRRWLKVGNNRLWALREMGWKYAPCLVTGECVHPCVKVTLEEANAMLKDGYLVWEDRDRGTQLILKDMCLAANHEYPSDT